MKYISTCILALFILPAVFLASCDVGASPALVSLTLISEGSELLHEDVHAKIEGDTIYITFPHALRERDELIFSYVAVCSSGAELEVANPIDFAKLRELSVIYQTAMKTYRREYGVYIAFEKNSALSLSQAVIRSEDNAVIADAYPEGLDGVITDEAVVFSLPEDYHDTTLILLPSFKANDLILVHPTTRQDFTGGRDVYYTFQDAGGQPHIVTVRVTIKQPASIASFAFLTDKNPIIRDAHPDGVKGVIIDNNIYFEVDAALYYKKELILLPHIEVVGGSVVDPRRQDYKRPVYITIRQDDTSALRDYKVTLSLRAGYIGVQDIELESINIDGQSLWKAAGLWSDAITIDNPADTSFFLEVSPELDAIVKNYPVRLDIDFLFPVTDIDPPLESLAKLPRSFKISMYNQFTNESESKRITIDTKIVADNRPKSIYLYTGREKNVAFLPAHYDEGRVAIDPWTFERVIITLHDGQTATWDIAPKATAYVEIEQVAQEVLVSFHEEYRFTHSDIKDYQGNITLFSLKIEESGLFGNYDFFWLPEPSIYTYGWLPGRSSNLPSVDAYASDDMLCRARGPAGNPDWADVALGCRSEFTTKTTRTRVYTISPDMINSIVNVNTDLEAEDICRRYGGSLSMRSVENARGRIYQKEYCSLGNFGGWVDGSHEETYDEHLMALGAKHKLELPPAVKTALVDFTPNEQTSTLLWFEKFGHFINDISVVRSFVRVTLDQYNNNDKLYYRALELARPAYSAYPVKIIEPEKNDEEASLIYYNWLAKFTLSGNESKTYTYTNIHPQEPRTIVTSSDYSSIFLGEATGILHEGKYTYVKLEPHSASFMKYYPYQEGTGIRTYSTTIKVSDERSPSTRFRVVRLVQSNQQNFPSSQLIESYQSNVILDLIPHDTEYVNETGLMDYADLVYHVRVLNLID